MSLIDVGEEPHGNPLDVVERVAAANGWSFERAGGDEITILVTGKWTDYQVPIPGCSTSKRCIWPVPSS